MGNDKMSQHKAAVIGLGNIGMEYDVTSVNHPASHTMAYILNNHFQLECAMDLQIKKKETLQRFSSTTDFYTNIQTMFEEHPDVDIVSICTPPQNHLQNIEYLVQNTRVPYIFCEKPLISSLNELPSLKKLLGSREFMLIPNLSRRWSPKIQEMREHIVSQDYGKLQKVLVRYTRGIYNTGAHLFDLLHWCGITITQVQVLNKVYTTSERIGEPTFSFAFYGSKGINGYVEAFDDTQYYFFDIDFYFSNGKIEFKHSGDDVFYYSVGKHHLFSDLPALKLDFKVHNILSDSCLAGAMNDWNAIMNKQTSPRCSWQDAIYPLYVAHALEDSYKTGQNVYVQTV